MGAAEAKPDDLVKQMEGLKIQEEKKVEDVENPFSKKLNKELLEKIHQTSKENQLKFSNPIRDYCHLLSNRLIIFLIELEKLCKEAE